MQAEYAGGRQTDRINDHPYYRLAVGTCATRASFEAGASAASPADDAVQDF